MNENQASQIYFALNKLNKEDWQRLFNETPSLKLLLDNARSAAIAQKKPTLGEYSKDIISLFGLRLLSDRKIGGAVRELLVKRATQGNWDKLIAVSRKIYKSKVSANIRQTATGPKILASLWRTGSPWAKEFCSILNLPVELAMSFTSSENDVPPFEVISPVVPLKPLHDFQEEVYQRLRSVLTNKDQQTLLLSLPTGAGKTRVAVESVCDHLASNNCTDGRDVVLWISQSRELLAQAWECFSQIWQVPPLRKIGIIPRRDPLQLIKVWEHAEVEGILARLDQNGSGSTKTVIVAGIQMLHSWKRNSKQVDFFDNFPLDRLCCCIVDEAHSLITKQYSEVLQALRLKKHDKKRPEWLPVKGSGLVLGLTATPWRSDDEQTNSLIRYFGQGNLLYPQRKLGINPIDKLQKMKILSQSDVESLKISNNIQFTGKEKEQLVKFHEIPESYLQRLGLVQERNAAIISKLKEFPKTDKILVFACSIDHAKILSVALNRCFGPGTAMIVTGETPKGLRTAIIENFKDETSSLRFICNVGVLTTGFDAPKTDVVCITRPTMSEALYEQMIGRGLRGKKNGGTDKCTILDVQDADMPEGIQSYGRVIGKWKNYRSTAKG